MTVPLQVYNIGNEQNKIGINVSINGSSPIPVTFDTGGNGLHVYQSQVNVTPPPNAVYATASFGGGLELYGYIANVPVTINGITTDPMPVMIVTKAFCSNGSNCGVNGPQDPMYGLFYGELGASSTIGKLPVQNPENSADAYTYLCSPFYYLPGNYSSGFIVQNLTPANDVNGGQGELVLGLNSQNQSGFEGYPLPVMENTQCPGINAKIYDDKALKFHYTIGDTTETYSTSFDTEGGSSVEFFNNNSPFPLQDPNSQSGLVQSGLPFSLTRDPINWQFTTGDNPNDNEAIVKPIPDGITTPWANTGFTFFLNYNVIFDYHGGNLRFAPNPMANQ
jgi:hypothetical protein